MKCKIHIIVLTVIKNLLAFLAGGVLGALAIFIFAEPILKFAIKKDVGLGIIAVAPAVLIIYAIVFTVTGGVICIIVYNVLKLLRLRRKENLQNKKKER